ncbi:TonB-dependent siderophore receptor [Luteimonas sp. RIT-PG2_3]
MAEAREGVAAPEADAHADARASIDASTATELDVVTVYGRRIGRIPGETATKSGAAVLETPFSVNIVPRELLDLRNVSNIGQAVETVSGVQRTIGFSGNQRFRIRGFQAISTLRDGFRQSVSQPEIDLQGIDSIEVLKGPASALYGRFEPGGVINFVSKRPQEAFAAQASLTSGSDQYTRAGIDVGGPLDSGGTWLGRFNASYEDAGSFREFVDNRQLFVSPVLEWRPDADTSLLLRIEYIERDAAFDRGFGNSPLFLDQPISRNYGEPFMRVEKQQWTTVIEFNRQLNDAWRLRLGTFWSYVDVPRERFFNYGFPTLSGTSISRNFIRYHEQQKDVTAQAELYGALATGPVRHAVLAGVERVSDRLAYLDGTIAYGNPIDLHQPQHGARPRDEVPTGDSRYDYRSSALYLQDEMTWARWRLLLGGRFDRTETVSFYTGGIDPAITRRDSPFSPRAGLTFLATPDVSLYASWARSFRNEADAGLLESGVTPAPTRGDQRELGIKSLLLDGRVETTLALFDLRKQNAVVADPLDWNRVLQTGELRVRGVEAEVSARPFDALTLVASYAFSDATITEDTSPLLVGNRLAGVPRHQASLWATWSFDGRLRGLSVGGGVFHASEQAATTSNSFFLPAYTRLDLNARYVFGDGIDILLNLDNVTGERYFMTGGFSQIYPQAPRTARLTLSKRW